MNPIVKVIIHPVTIISVVLSVAFQLIVSTFQLDPTWAWVIGILLAATPLVTAQITAVHGTDIQWAMPGGQFHLIVVAIAGGEAFLQMFILFIQQAPATVHIPALVVGVLIVVKGIADSVANQLHLTDPVAPSAG